MQDPNIRLERLLRRPISTTPEKVASMNCIQHLINDAMRVFGKKTLASDIAKSIKYCRRGWFCITVIVAILGSGTARATAPVNDIQRLSLSEQHGCAITLGGALRCYGNNGQGQLGNGASGAYAKFAEQIIAGGVTAVWQQGNNIHARLPVARCSAGETTAMARSATARRGASL